MQDLNHYKKKIERLVGQPVITIQSLQAGKNARVLAFETRPGMKYVLKHYYNHPADHRTRLDTEIAAYRFLWHHGQRNIPKPICHCRASNMAIFEFIEGLNGRNRSVSIRDINNAMAFIRALRRISQKAPPDQFGAASEACFSFSELHRNLSLRIDQLMHGDPQDSVDLAMRDYLVSQLIPFFKATVKGDRTEQMSSTSTCYTPLPPRHRVLSPSDFGFHNAIQKKDGAFVYLDFEYFGWDDPAKLLSDFILHPGMAIRPSQQHYFAKHFFPIFPEDKDLRARFARVFAAYGIKWSLIMLNEFIPVNLGRRCHARVGIPDPVVLKTDQLQKSKQKLNEVKELHETKGFFDC